MKIYIDFDDVICETAKEFTRIARELFGIDLPYTQFQFFNMKQTFGLNDDQYDKLMQTGHLPENLLRYEETPGASEVINRWVEEGHEVSVITGRPLNAYEPSREWLDRHGLQRVPMFCVDKYGREKPVSNFTFSMTLETLYRKDFDFIIEDSPAALDHVMHFPRSVVAIFDRPWNRDMEFPGERFVRCNGWKEIGLLFDRTIRNASVK